MERFSVDYLTDLRPTFAVHRMESFGVPTFREAFRRNRYDLVQSMRVNCSFLNRLRDKGLLTGHYVQAIQSCSTEADRVDQLLSILERSDNTLFQDFIDALVEDEQQHVVRDCFQNLHSCVGGSGRSRLTMTQSLSDLLMERKSQLRAANRLKQLHEELIYLLKNHDILYRYCLGDTSCCAEVLHPLKREVEAAVGRFHTTDVSTMHKTGIQELHRILDDLYRSISRRLDAHRVADAMLPGEGLTPEEHSAIKDRTQRQATAETLLNILLKDSHCTKFDSFLQALIDTDQKQIYVDIVSEALVTGCDIGANHRRQVREFRLELVNSVNARYSSFADLLDDSESWLSQREYEELRAIIEHWNSVRDVLIASLQTANTTNQQPTQTVTPHNWISLLGHLLRA